MLDTQVSRSFAARVRGFALGTVFVLALGPAVVPTIAAEPAGAVSADVGGGLRDELRTLIGDARDRVFPALVSIRVTTVDYVRGQEFKGTSTGSGAIISAEGYVITNYHVTKNGTSYLCTLSDKQEVEARLIGEDPLTDLAVLQLETDQLAAAGDPLPVAVFGDSDRLETGEHVMAMGSPFSLSRSVSLGIVSNTERVFAGGFGSDELDEMELQQGERTGLFTRWIQHDALINPGNSGGPLVNLGGEIVGVNELGGSAIGFAIPSNLARRVADALIAHGEVPRSWLGISFKPIRKTGHDRGVLVDSVVTGGPASEAGIAAGDVVLALDGTAVTVRFVEEVPLLLDRLASLSIDSTVDVTLSRDGTEQTVQLETEKLTKDLGPQTAFLAWGLSVQEITPKMARDRNLDATDGVLVTGVRRGGPAQLAEPGLEPGDVLRAIEGEPVAALGDAVAAYDRHSAALLSGEAEAEPLVFEFDRRGQNQLTLVLPRDDESEDPPRELPKAWIGVATQPLVPQLASRLGYEDVRGFRITRVYPGTLAAEADLEVGDVLQALDDETFAPNGVEDSALLSRAIRRRAIDDAVELSVWRDGTVLQVPITLERTRLSPEEARSHRDSDFELTVRELTFFDRDENRWQPEVRGVLVQQVESSGWAGRGGIRPFDLVQRLGENEIRGLKTYRAALRTLKRSQPERIEVVVLRGAKSHFLTLEPAWSPADTD